MRKTLLLCVALTLSTALAGGGGAPPPKTGAVTHVPTTLNFGDFTSKAEWTYPAKSISGQVSGKLPAVLLIHGSSAADLNFTYRDQSGKEISHIFLDIADGLSAQGVAVLRYNKHYVNSNGQADQQKFNTKASLQMFLQDAETALKAIKANPRVDPKRIFVYGWSEGSTVAAALVRQHPEVAGLILQGPVLMPWADLFDAQLTDVQVPYLKQVVPAGLTNENFMQALRGPGGAVAQSGAFFAIDPQTFASGKLALNPAFDTNKDKIIELDSEYVPGVREALKFLISSPKGFLNMYSPQRALPDVTVQLPQIKSPVLVLQGENDASTPAKYLDHLKEVSSPARVTIKTYPGLGHSLGQTSSILTDNFQPIDAQPIADTAAWIKAF